MENTRSYLTEKILLCRKSFIRDSDSEVARRLRKIWNRHRQQRPEPEDESSETSFRVSDNRNKNILMLSETNPIKSGSRVIMTSSTPKLTTTSISTVPTTTTKLPTTTTATTTTQTPITEFSGTSRGTVERLIVCCCCCFFNVKPGLCRIVNIFNPLPSMLVISVC